MTPNISPEQLSAYHKRGRELLLEQTESLNAVIHDLHILDPKQRRAAIWMPALMLQAVGVSIHSVLTLTLKRDMAIRDCFGIARSAVETALNAAFIAAGGDEVAGRALRHMRQKRWRDLRRQTTIGNLKISTSRDIGAQVSDFPGLQEALDEFTSKRGREVTDWTQATVQDRVSAISTKNNRAGIALGAAVFGIYRTASELLHGSYYGVNHFWQGSRATPAKDPIRFDYLWLMEHFTTLLSTLFLGVAGAIETVALVYDLDGHATRQSMLSVQLQLLIDAIAAEDPDDEHRFTADIQT